MKTIDIRLKDDEVEMGYLIYYNARAIEFMNPAIDSIEAGSYSSTTPFYFSSGGYQYVWDKTVRLYYS